ncbi:MAG TPA: hypothetical protein VIC27_07685 [Ktedonobacterales bacterium]
MSWFTPILMTVDQHSVGASSPYATESFFAATTSAAVGRGAGLGSARASGQWAWSAEPVRLTPPAQMATQAATTASGASVTRGAAAREGACLRAPVALLSQMSEAARALGRSESEVWVEAARAWLRKREGEPGAPPAAAAPTAVEPVSAPRRIARLWDDIDALLFELRAPALAVAHECEGVPAA